MLKNTWLCLSLTKESGFWVLSVRLRAPVEAAASHCTVSSSPVEKHQDFLSFDSSVGFAVPTTLSASEECVYYSPIKMNILQQEEFDDNLGK